MRYTMTMNLITKHLKTLFTQLMRHTPLHTLFNDAASMTCFTLLTIVPLMSLCCRLTVLFVDAAVVEMILQDYLVQHFLPASITALQPHLMMMISRANHVSWVDISMLLMASILLIHNACLCVYRIWGENVRLHHILNSMLLSVILIIIPGFLVVLSLQLQLLTQMSSFDFLSPYLHGILEVFTLISPVVVLSLAYAYIPQSKTSYLLSLGVAVMVVCLSYLANMMMSWWFHAFHLYEIIYGTLTVIPMTILWIYTHWILILFGVSVNFCCQQQLNGNTDD